MNEHDEVYQWDAAYVMGSLDAAGRRRFEEHLQDCERCRNAVAELGGLPGLLSRAPHPADVPESIPAPPPDLLEKTRRRKALRHRRTAARLAFALAATVALVLAIGIPLALRPQEPAVSVAMQQVAGPTMSARVGMDQVAWGTKLSVECDYPQGEVFGDENGPWSYALLVTDAAGTTTQVSTWKAVPGRQITLQAATSLPLEQITTITVQTLAGHPVLRAAVPEN